MLGRVTRKQRPTLARKSVRRSSTHPLKGRTALITGSTSGIGLGFAQAFAKNGANIIINGFGPADEIKKITHDLATTYHVKVHYNGADMTVPEQIRNMIKEAEEKFGGVDILVNNAGIQHVSPVESFPDNKWDRIFCPNIFVPMIFLHHFRGHRHQLVCCFPRNESRHSPHEKTRMGTHHQRVFGTRPRGFRPKIRLRCFEARCRWTFESDSVGIGRKRRNCELYQSWMDFNAVGAKAN